MLPAIDFHSIRPHAGSQHRAFEELCYQLLPVIEQIPSGAKFVRHGTPDGGVEGLAILSNGDVWGWQAKYLFALTDAEFTQLDGSVREAFRNYPELTRYTFCLPYDRPAASAINKRTNTTRKSAMQRWNEHVEKWSSWAQDQGQQVEFHYVGQSDLLKALTLPGQSGRALYWFDATVLGPDWFKEQLERVLEDAGPRYTAELNINLPIAQVFEGLGRTAEFQRRLRRLLGEVRDRRSRWYETAKLSRDDDALAALLAAGRPLLDEIDARVMAIDLGDSSPVDFDGLAALCRNASDVCDDSARHIWSVSAEHQKREQTEGKTADNWWAVGNRYEAAASEMRRTSSALEELVELVTSDAARLVNVAALLVFGGAGTGKTHLFCDVAKSRCDANRPTVIVLGQYFSAGDPWQEILTHLHLTCAVDAFLGALEVAAETCNARALILIDAMNEGEGIGVWPAHLGSFLAKLRGHPLIGVALSCRTTYIDDVVPQELRKSRMTAIEHRGFAGHEYAAVRNFFSYYHLVLPDFPLLVPEFTNPLFLKLLCKGLSDAGLSSIPRGSTGVTWLFRQFLDAANRRLSRHDRCDYPEASSLVWRAVEALGEAMLNARTDYLPFEVARALTEKLLPDRPWSQSLLAGLLNEGVLIRERGLGLGDSSELILFAYQRLGDHRIAAAICDRDPSADALATECARMLGDPDLLNLGGLLEALAILVPERFGEELYTLVPHDRRMAVVAPFLESITWRDPQAFPGNAALEFLKEIANTTSWGSDRVLTTLLQVSCVPDHPFNADLLHSTLWRQSMPTRDEWWSIFLHWHYEPESTISRIVEWASSKDTSYCTDESALLCSTTLAWFLTSSNRFLRDRATKSLVSLLRTRLDVLVRLLDRFDGANDPYVTERLFAVAYGCALISQDKSGIARLADWVYAHVFAEDQPPLDILLRNYARGIIERALHLNGSLDGVVPAAIRPPYESPWPLRLPTKDLLRTRYKDQGSYPHFRFSLDPPMGDFGRYIVESRLHHFVAPNQEARKREERRRARTQAKQAHESWKTFVASLDTHQEEMLTNLVDSESTPPESFSVFEGSLSAEQRDQFFRNVGISNAGHSNPRPSEFDASRVPSWIIQRVVRMGWTPESFGEFDRIVNQRNMRETRKAERMGKKYQWIAFHDLLSRVADHCLLMPEWVDDESHPYRGPWQLWSRDIDPSLLTAPTAAEGTVSPGLWWSPVSGVVPQGATPDLREVWLRDEKWLPDLEGLIEVVGDNGRSWLNLEGHYEWKEVTPPEVDEYRTDHCRLWYQVRGYIIRSEDLGRFEQWAKGQDWMGRWMPESLDMHQVFLGEFPWHESVAEYEFMWQENRQKGLTVPLMVPSAGYTWEGNSFDCSIDDSVFLQLPSPFLVSLLGLSWQGVDAKFVDDAGTLVALDPGAGRQKPSCLLVDRDRLLDGLGRKGLTLVWTVLGEKMVFGDSIGMADRDHGRLMISGSYRLEGGELRQIDFVTRFEDWRT